MNKQTLHKCPGPAEMAAFIEGNLTGSRLQAMVAHVAKCPACQDAVSEGFAYLDEVGSEETELEPAGERREREAALVPSAPPAGRVLAFPKGKAALALGAVAAMLALIFLLPKAPSSDTERLAWLKEMDVSTGDFGSAGLTNHRNPGISASTFASGVLFTRITAASTLGDERLVAETRSELDEILKNLEVGDERPAALEDLERWLISALPRSDFEWGQWTETGRLAATVGATKVLEVHWQHKPTTDPPDVRALNDSVEILLGRIQGHLADGVAPEDLTSLAEDFAELNNLLSSPLRQDS